MHRSFIQNLRRYLGYDVQYFAAVQPQKRLASHVHVAMRRTVARAEIRRVLAATYHQVRWPDTLVVRFDGDELPVWDQALDAIGQDHQPHYVVRFGEKLDAQGVLAGSKDAARCIGYLTKYLTQQVGHCHQAQTPPKRPTRRGWRRRCGSSRARRPARTGCGTASACVSLGHAGCGPETLTSCAASSIRKCNILLNRGRPRFPRRQFRFRIAGC